MLSLRFRIFFLITELCFPFAQIKERGITNICNVILWEDFYNSKTVL